MTCATHHKPEVYVSSLSNMGITLFPKSDRTYGQILNLTPREMEICSMHFVDGLSETTIAEWLKISVQGVRQCIARSIQREPRLRKLARQPLRFPKIRCFSELRQSDREAGPFNSDEL